MSNERFRTASRTRFGRFRRNTRPEIEVTKCVKTWIVRIPRPISGPGFAEADNGHGDFGGRSSGEVSALPRTLKEVCGAICCFEHLVVSLVGGRKLPCQVHGHPDGPVQHSRIIELPAGDLMQKTRRNISN